MCDVEIWDDNREPTTTTPCRRRPHRKCCSMPCPYQFEFLLSSQCLNFHCWVLLLLGRLLFHFLSLCVTHTHTHTLMSRPDVWAKHKEQGLPPWLTHDQKVFRGRTIKIITVYVLSFLAGPEGFFNTGLDSSSLSLSLPLWLWLTFPSRNFGQKFSAQIKKHLSCVVNVLSERGVQGSTFWG